MPLDAAEGLDSDNEDIVLADPINVKNSQRAESSGLSKVFASGAALDMYIGIVVNGDLRDFGSVVVCWAGTS